MQCIHTYMQCIHTCTHTYMHAYIHTCIQIYLRCTICMCARRGRHLQDCEKICCRYCKIAKKYVVYLGILPILGKKEYREDAQQQTSRNGGKIMVRDSRKIYGGRFAGILWLGRLEVNPTHPLNDA